jgi:hypothetical protein
LDLLFLLFLSLSVVTFVQLLAGFLLLVLFKHQPVDLVQPYWGFLLLVLFFIQPLFVRRMTQKIVRSQPILHNWLSLFLLQFNTKVLEVFAAAVQLHFFRSLHEPRFFTFQAIQEKVHLKVSLILLRFRFVRFTKKAGIVQYLMVFPEVVSATNQQQWQLRLKAVLFQLFGQLFPEDTVVKAEHGGLLH